MARELHITQHSKHRGVDRMQPHVHPYRPRPTHLTLLDVIETVNDITKDEEQTAEVINYMLESEHISFTNTPPRELRQLS